MIVMFDAAQFYFVIFISPIYEDTTIHRNNIIHHEA